MKLKPHWLKYSSVSIAFIISANGSKLFTVSFELVCSLGNSETGKLFPPPPPPQEQIKMDEIKHIIFLLKEKLFSFTRIIANFFAKYSLR